MILLDEPFGALDVQTKNYMIHDLQSLWTEANKTIVMVTHSVSEGGAAGRPRADIQRAAVLHHCRHQDRPAPSRGAGDEGVKAYEDEVTRILSAEVDKSMSMERARGGVTRGGPAMPAAFHIGAPDLK